QSHSTCAHSSKHARHSKIMRAVVSCEKGRLHVKSSPMVKELIERHFEVLSKKQRAIATFILNNPSFIGTHAASLVGARTGTSETTVIRFCYALGLDGYKDLQKQIRMYLFQESSSVSSLGNYLASKEEFIDDEELVQKAANKEM